MKTYSSQPRYEQFIIEEKKHLIVYYNFDLKLPMYGVRASDVEKFLKLSLENLGLQYVDMYLIHSPMGLVQAKDKYEVARNDDNSVIIENTDHVSTWKVIRHAFSNC